MARNFSILFAYDFDDGSPVGLSADPVCVLSLVGRRVSDGTPLDKSGRGVEKAFSVSSVTLARRSWKAVQNFDSSSAHLCPN